MDYYILQGFKFSTVQELCDFDETSFRLFSQGHYIRRYRYIDIDYIHDIFADGFRHIVICLRNMKAIRQKMREDMCKWHASCSRWRNRPWIRLNLEIRLDVLASVHCWFRRYLFLKMTAIELDYKVFVKDHFNGTSVDFDWEKISDRMSDIEILQVRPLVRKFGLLHNTPALEFRVRTELDDVEENIWQDQRQVLLAKKFQSVYHPMAKHPSVLRQENLDASFASLDTSYASTIPYSDVDDTSEDNDS